MPIGSEPSTHIFKSAIAGLTRQDIDEHLSLDASARLGLTAARSRILDLDGEAAVNEFFDANVYNWIISGTDAHAKNYSLLHTERGTTLAPLYDIASALPYPDLHPRRVKLAMAVAGHDRIWEIDSQYWARQAVEISIEPDAAVDRMRAMIDNAPDAFSDAVAAAGLKRKDLRFAAGLVDRVAARTTALKRTATATPPRANPAPRSRAHGMQFRRKDVGQPGNGGRFAARPNG